MVGGPLLNLSASKEVEEENPKLKQMYLELAFKSSGC